MQLVDYGYVDEELEWFDLPSKPGAQIGGPSDLTGRQDDQLTAIVKALPDDASNIDFYLTILTYWTALPGTRWNLARREIKGDPDSRLCPIPLTAETVREEITRTDRAKIGMDVVKLLYPNAAEMFGLEEDPEEPVDDLMDDLEAEEGSQASEDEAPDPNAGLPSPNDGMSPERP